MARGNDKRWRVHRELAGAPMRAGSATITPVVRMEGVIGSGVQPGGGRFEWGWLRLVPLRAEVRTDTGAVTTLLATDIHDTIARNMALAAGFIAATAMVLMAVRSLRR